MAKVSKEQIQSLLMENDRAVERALVVLFHRQTSDEQVAEDTKHHNDRGFTQADAKRMTSMAKWIQRGGRLSERQLIWLRNRRSSRFHSRIGKYWRQLAEAAAAKAAGQPEAV